LISENKPPVLVSYYTRNGKEFWFETIGLAELEPEPDDTENSKYFELYDYWISKW